MTAAILCARIVDALREVELVHLPSPAPDTYPISIKGATLDATGRILLLKNERDEWELPGGRLESGETPEACVAREIFEETRWRVTAGPTLDSWMYYINAANKHVFIVTYGCFPESDVAPVLSHEHKEVGLFSEAEVTALTMPEGYRRSIATWFGSVRREMPRLQP